MDLKRNKMKKTKNKTFYDNGFGYKAYICPNCGGRKLTRIVQWGFTPPKYTCDDCCIKINSPSWENITDEEKKELGIVDEVISPHSEIALQKYYANLEENKRILKGIAEEFYPKVEKAVKDKDLNMLVQYEKLIEPLPIGLAIRISTEIKELKK